MCGSDCDFCNDCVLCTDCSKCETCDCCWKFHCNVCDLDICSDIYDETNKMCKRCFEDECKCMSCNNLEVFECERCLRLTCKKCSIQYCCQLCGMIDDDLEYIPKINKKTVKQLRNFMEEWLSKKTT